MCIHEIVLVYISKIIKVRLTYLGVAVNKLTKCSDCTLQVD